MHRSHATKEGSAMRAFVRDSYGPPETLRIESVPKPTLAEDEVLLRVVAASANPADWHILRGEPRLARASLGLLRPKHTILGCDVAGTIEAVGPGVTGFEPGEEIFATLLEADLGGFAEYVAAPVAFAARKPAQLSFEEAAALPTAGATALQGLHHHGEIRPGMKVLINGASGGVGHFAVQIASGSGAEVTGVCSTRNVDLVHSLGADHVVDYTTTDFTHNGQYYDFILDAVGNQSVTDLRRTLARGVRQPSSVSPPSGGSQALCSAGGRTSYR